MQRSGTTLRKLEMQRETCDLFTKISNKSLANNHTTHDTSRLLPPPPLPPPTHTRTHTFRRTPGTSTHVSI